MNVRTKHKKKKRRGLSPQKRHFLRIIAQLCLVISLQLRELFPNLSEERIRGILAELQREALIGSSKMPKHGNAAFYYITKRGLRVIGKKSRWTHPSVFAPGALYDVYARSLFSSAEIIEPGKPARVLLRPKDFEDRYPKYSSHFRGRHYALDQAGHIYLLQPVKAPDAHRLVGDCLKRLRTYAEHTHWHALLKENRFSYVLLLPTDGLAEKIRKDIEQRASNRENYSATRDSTPLEKKLQECLVCFPRRELGRLLL